MLIALTIRNYILIDDVNLDFRSGFSVFTGETGAGKSILIDAIGLLSGDRFSVDMIRQGQDKAYLEAVFMVKPGHHSLLEELGIETEEDQLIISRELNQDGRSINRINQRSVTLAVLKEISSVLVDLHSQHDTQKLLNPKMHITLLDRYHQNTELLSKVKEAYQMYLSKRRAYEQLVNESQEQDVSFIHYQLNEIEQAKLTADEDNVLEEELKRMMNFEKISTRLQESLGLLDENDGVRTRLYESLRLLKSLDDEQLNSIHNSLSSYYYGILEDIESLRSQFNQLSFDELRFNTVQERLLQLNRLKKKYGRDILGILDFKDELEHKLERIENRQNLLEAAEHETEQSLKVFMQYAESLSDVRKEASIQLKQDILEQLRPLYLENARFDVGFSQKDASSDGIDQLEFLISMNEGEALRELAKVASGGELSRLMLGLKVIFNHLQGISTIIFDEIDTGVSGRVASAIGQRMKKISENAQVLTVTHLAQVAAYADYHYQVYKHQESGNTQTTIKLLDEEERKKELSLILTGSLSEQSLAAASDLLDKAKQHA